MCQLKYAVITGASKGLGASLAMQLVGEGYGMVSLSRSENQELENLAGQSGLFYMHKDCDLAEPSAWETFELVAESLFKDDVEEVLLLNNAGMVEPIDTVGRLTPELVQSCVQINVTAPILLTNAFVEKAKQKDTKLTVINVTSGAAERPVAGWGVYGSTKAALNLFTETAALEQKIAGSSSTIIGYSPGIMDTNMQEVIRASTKDSFQDVETFIDYKEKGMLRSPDVVAEALVHLLRSGNVENGRIYRVGELLG